jgi:hypothetical protein
MDTYLDHAKTEILVLLNTRNTVLSGGTAKDFAEYKYIVGEISGLNRAIGIIDDLQQRINKSNGDIDEDDGSHQ